jgi:hypothetical protein
LLRSWRERAGKPHALGALALRAAEQLLGEQHLQLAATFADFASF